MNTGGDRAATGRRPPSKWLCHAVGLLSVGFSLTAEDPKSDEKKPEPPKPPQIALVLPLGVEAGSSNRLTIRGQFLTNSVVVTIRGLPTPPEVKVYESGEAPKIEGQDAGRVGDQRLEIGFTLAADTPTGTNIALVVTSPDGESKPFALFVGSAGQFSEEHEPNNGFRTAAAPPPLGKILRGALESPADVDVIRFSLKSGETLRAEVWAARLGATLDSLLTIYDRRGATLKSNDDRPELGRDSFLEFVAAAEGEYFLAISGVTEKAGSGSVYLLVVTQ
ncbi:MAG TPA: PPC domain-containing protein [Verrucomicrobiota bacterium]|nr:PPC domain-containing protein [Verrucomicrobiota bacterium]